MFDIDGDGGWDVSQEADSLTKSLFGGTKKKKSNKKAAKDVSNIPSPLILEDSDDETFTKKGMRKLKEKRRRKKKHDKKGEEENVEKSFSHTKQMKENGTDHETCTASNNSKTDKKKNSSDTEADSDLKGNKSNKRKKDLIEVDKAEPSNGPSKKRKTAETNEASINPSSPSVGETPKKKRRNRKKKNNSKKNKYAHLALNRKVKEPVESAKGNSDSLTVRENEHEMSSTPDETTPSQEKIPSKKNKKNFKKVSNEHSEIDETGSSTKNRNTSEKGQSKNSETENAPHINSKKGKKSKLDLGEKKNEADVPENDSLGAKKKKKRKEDSPSTPTKKLKVESPSEEHTDLSILSQTKKSKKNKSKKGINENNENPQLQEVEEKMNTVKDSKTFDSERMLELQQRQKSLLQALSRSSRGTENPESTDLKEKKKKSKSLESSASKKQLQNTNSNPASQNPQAGTSVTKSGLPRNKSSVESQSKENLTDSTGNKSIWGEKASALGSQAQEKLNSARFRYLNEQLYTCQGKEALQLFREDCDAFKIYHTGFENQASKWPVNPVNVLIKQIKDKSPSLVVADFGCGDAKLAQALPQNVHSFDLVALNPWVKACDMSNVPLQSESVDIAVFCLSLMGTNLADYIREANRVLKTDGLLKVVEVVSRFNGLSPFIAAVCSHGFQLLNKRDLSQMFYLMDFKKVKFVKKGATTKSLSLKPCLYKKR